MRNGPSDPDPPREPKRAAAGSRRRWPRRVAFALGLSALLPFLARLALELPPVRAAIFGLVAERVREASTLELAVADWRVALLRRQVVVEGLTLRDAAGRDVLAVDRLEAVADGSALLGGALALRRLEIVEPRLDLALWPELPVRESTPEGSPAFELRRLVVRGGAVEGGPMPADAAGWVGAWRTRDVEVEGSLRDGALSLAAAGEVLVEGERIGSRALTVALAKVAGPLAGPWRVEGLEVRGDGLELDVPVAELGTRPGDPWRASLRLAADLGRLGPELGGTARADGELDLRRRRGRLRLDASGLPGELLEPWLGREALAALGAAGSTLDARADVDLASGADGAVAGEATLRWMGRRSPLLEVSAELTGGGVDAAGVLDWASLAGELRATGEDLPAEALRPFLGAERFAQLSLEGALVDVAAEITASAADLRAAADTGSIGALDASLRGVLAKRGERWVTLRAATTQGPAVAGSNAIALELALELWPALAGERRVEGMVWVPSRAQIAQARLHDVIVSLRAPDLPELHRALESRVPGLLAALPATIEPDLLRTVLLGAATARAELSGPWREPAVDAALDWTPSAGSAVALRARGRIATPLAGEAELRLSDVDLAPFAPLFARVTSSGEATEAPVPALAGVVAGDAALSGSLEQPRGTMRLRATGLVLAAGVEPIEELVLEASGEKRRVDVSRIVVRAPAGRLEGDGWFEPRLPLGEAAASVLVSAPDSGVERALLALRLADDVLRVDSRELLTRAGPGQVAAVVPLLALHRLDGLPEAITRALPPRDEAAGAQLPLVELRAHVPALTSDGLAAMFELPEAVPIFSLQELVVEARLDLARPAAAEVTLQLADLVVEVREPELAATSAQAPETHTLRLARPLLATLRGGELQARELRLQVDQHELLVDAEATLATDWSAGEPTAELVRDVRAQARGAVPASALDPFLAGGVARGLLDLRAVVAGPLDALAGSVRVDGTGASVLYRSPYLSRLADPVLEVEIRDGRAVLRSGSATLNEGPVKLTGEASLASGLDLRAAFSEVRYRLDYGISVELGGELQLRWPLAVEGPPAPGRSEGPVLRGEVLVERGLLRRDLDLEREVLAVLRGVETADTTDFARQLALDLTVATASGVRVRNNVADLRVRWTPIGVRGTLAEPILDGLVEVDPGGTVVAYGQRARVDRGLLRFPGRPGAEPQFALDVTTALEDPSLLAVEDSSLDPFAGAGEGVAAEGPAAEDVLLAGFAEYFGGRLAAGLGRGLGESVRLSLRPIGLLNEADPDARLTVGRDLNRYLTLGVSFNLRQAEQRTYLLDVREVPRAPRMLGQVFTNEAGNEGATLQQSLELGRGGARVEREPRLRRLRITAPPGVGEAAIRRAIALQPGDAVYDGATFDVEIEASDALVRRGYSDPKVVVTTQSVRRSGTVDVVVRIDPGPRAQVAFTGDPPPARARTAIATLYRSDYYEPAALEEMARATEAALRGEGFLEPRATARVAPAASPEETRQVTVEATGGRRAPLDRVVWQGLGEEAGEEAIAGLDERFAARRWRVELATGRPGADAAVRDSLAALGYLDAAVRGRSLSSDGEELVVELEPGPLVRVAGVAVAGAPGGLVAAPALEAGMPLRGDTLAAAAFEIEDALRAAGHLDARVALDVERSISSEATVRFDVAAGERYRLGEVDVVGLGATSPALVRRLVGTAPGDVLGEAQLDDARRSLFETGLFSSVVVQPARDLAAGQAASARLGVQVEEIPRFQLGYGLRYETDVGLGVVVDAIDRNLAGWGAQLGARLLYRSDDQRARLWFSSPRLAGSELVLEGFAQVAEEILDEGEELETRIDSFDSGLQLSRPLGGRSRGGVYARFREETFSFDDPFFGPFEETLRFPILGVQYLYRGVQDPFQRASRGLWASADLSGSDEAIGGQLRFVRLFGQVGLVTSPFQVAGRTVDWAQLYRLGLADAFDQELVRAERFFAGGAFSVRGYPREGLGPFESLGDVERPLGGEALFVMNQELRFPIAGAFGGVLFLDAGNVWERVDDFGEDMVFGVGAGARWQSPVGLLRLDLAVPLDAREGEKRLRLYFGFGHVF